MPLESFRTVLKVFLNGYQLAYSLHYIIASVLKRAKTA